jgi:hypothetical protein
VLWKRKGQPQFSQWLADKIIPHQYETSDPATGQTINMRLAETEGYFEDSAALYLNPAAGTGRGINMLTSLRHIGLSVDGLDFKTLATNLSVSLGITITYDMLGQYFDGFSIMRAPRDKQILCQGIWYPTLVADNVANTIPQIGDYFYEPNNHGALATARTDIYQFFSPELQFGFNNDAASPTSGDLVSVADYYASDFASGGAYSNEGQLDTNNYHFYHKFYVQHAAAANDKPKNISSNVAVDPRTVMIVKKQTGPA